MFFWIFISVLNGCTVPTYIPHQPLEENTGLVVVQFHLNDLVSSANILPNAEHSFSALGR
jgi:hypothetical protein